MYAQRCSEISSAPLTLFDEVISSAIDLTYVDKL